ncbi:AAA family ATPase [Nonomuraea sp. NEAU-A123]|uniref:ATP-binding protein n=1 Tax=Nonomuraea sp. NEAU-A123 TaxID=2839649 RepID=UPI001BE3EEFC|nr:LuxR family transcriptional regulator [Nonomuraea sp. NEAU-A123]MBT2235063.1 AAA family ATPase [Nonomuraea sp. NEAU-A123]
MDRVILEREDELATLADAARDAAHGTGTVVLISGEAGIGKSSLVEAIGGVLPPQARLLVGYCDDLATPRVLGPLRDLIGSVGPQLSQALEQGDRGEVLEALRTECEQAERPMVLVVEDVHWADEATLDVLRYLVRRIARWPLALVLTYRDDELGSGHRLRPLLGLIAGVDRVRRLCPARLTLPAVRCLTAAAAAGRGTRLDADGVYTVTCGNPYFVAEVLAAGDAAGVPLTIADAVQARLARLDPVALEVLQRLAVVPSAVPRWLVKALIPDNPTALAAAEQRGLITVTLSGVSFRHELARRVVVESMSTMHRMAANHAVLAAILTRPDIEVARVVHHAAQAGDTDALLRYGPIAAREAIAAGAHRAAAVHLLQVLDLHPVLDPPDEADLWQALAIENHTIDAPPGDTLAAQQRAVGLRRGGDPRALGTSLRWLSRICWWAGDPDGAAAAAAEAITVLEHCDDGLLAMALSNQAQLYALAGRDTEAIVVARRAIALGRNTPATLSHALNNLALALYRRDDPSATATMQESLRVALTAGEPEHACRAYVNLIGCEVERLRLDIAGRFAAEAIEFAERAEFMMFASYLQCAVGQLRLVTADWDDVLPAVRNALDGAPPARCAALILAGRARLRRGEAGAVEMLREAWQLALPLRERQRIAAAAAALAEAAALGHDTGVGANELLEVYELARDSGKPLERADLGYWLSRAGHKTDPAKADHPYALLAAGRWRKAAEIWHAAGCRYEHALAQADSPQIGDQLAALAKLDALGAQPLARLVRAGLKRSGVTRIPRGPVPATRANPAGLTERQTQVVQLLAQGLTNAQIAGRLVLSVRTVESHVAAVLEKLGSRTREQAVARAAELGLGAAPEMM